MGDIYTRVADRILKLVEEDNLLPWQRPWSQKGIVHNFRRFSNLISGKSYRGINTLILSCSPYSSPYWLTANQADNLCATVTGKPEEIVFYSVFNDKETDKKAFFMKSYFVYNADQCLGLKHWRLDELAEGVEEEAEEEKTENSAIRRARILVETYKENPNLRSDPTKAAYSPTFDYILMPPEDSFSTPDGYFGVYFHEIVHSTGHEKRLKRKDLMESNGFGSLTYSREELTAEMGSAFLSSVIGLDLELYNSAAYIKSWCKYIKNEPKKLFQASARAQKAVDYILERSYLERPKREAASGKRIRLKRRKF